jgi:MinD superfamily P-loop ATPase
MVLEYLKNVTTLKLDVEKCTGCRMCLSVCPHEVVVVVDKKARIARPNSCMECGACAQNCAFEAITVSSGVGCASAVIAAALGRKSDCCCDGVC